MDTGEFQNLTCNILYANVKLLFPVGTVFRLGLRWSSYSECNQRSSKSFTFGIDQKCQC